VATEATHGYALLLVKNIYGTKQAARKWHIHISQWLEDHGYATVNSEKTIFMKRQGADFILHGLFVDDMIHTSTSELMMKEFMQSYSKDFEITGGGIMESFLGLEVEHKEGKIHLHMDNYGKEVIEDYQLVITKALRPKRLPIAPNLTLRKEDCPVEADPLASHYRSFTMKLQHAATWTRFDIS
jgi:hypothetical protein